MLTNLNGYLCQNLNGSKLLQFSNRRQFTFYVYVPFQLQLYEV